jgi:hypothetical protein
VAVSAHCRLPRARPLEYVTPSGAPALEECLLRAAYSSDPEFAKEVPSSPAARLGNACHRVLELAGMGHLGPAGDPGWREAFETAWQEALEADVKRSRENPLEAHWPPPERWHGYGMRKVATRSLAARISSAARRERDCEQARGDNRGLQEHRQTAYSGRLRGRADVIRRNGAATIEDYKTGSIYEEGTDEIRSHYRVQLLLYAVLEHAETGSWPQRATLIPLEGDPATIEVDPQAAEAAADAALNALGRYNAEIWAGGSLGELGNPSPDICRFCPFAVRCPAFWTAVSPAWLEHGIVATAGAVVRIAESRLDTFNIELDAAAGSLEPGRCLLHGLDAQRFGAAVDAGERAHVAATNLAARVEERQVRPTQRTRLVVGT